jgi:hypothetical protein
MLLRYRLVVHVAVVGLGFTAPWDRWLPLDGRQKTWLALAAWPALHGWMSFRSATAAVLSLAILCAAAATWLQIGSETRLGIWLHTLSLTILMPPSGAVFAVVAVGAFELGMRRSLELVTASNRQWGRAVFAEIYFVGVALSFAALGWRYNTELLTQCVVVWFGISLVVRAFLPAQ